MSDFNTDKFLLLMSRVSRLEEETTYNYERDDKIDQLFKAVHEINTAMASNNAMIQSALKTAVTLIGMFFAIASGIWVYHSSQTAEIQHQVSVNSKMLNNELK